MMRWVGLAFVIALLVLAFFSYNRAPWLAVDHRQTTQLIWLMLAALLVSGTGYGFHRLRFDRGRVVAGALFWTAALLAAAGLYTLFR